jgi:hypothetical protein
MTDTAVYAATPRRHCRETDPRVAAASASLPIVNYVGKPTVADIIDSAVQTDIENGVHRVQLYPLHRERRKLTAALTDPASVVERYEFESGGVYETLEHWQLRAMLTVLRDMATP